MGKRRAANLTGRRFSCLANPSLIHRNRNRFAFSIMHLFEIERYFGMPVRRCRHVIGNATFAGLGHPVGR